MKTRFTPHLVDLTFDAALRSFWRKKALSAFLQRSEIAGLPAWLPDESKRDYLSHVFELLRSSDRGKAKILQLAQFLAEQTAFPDLEGWEDTTEKLDAATRSVAALKSYLHEQKESLASEQQRQNARRKLRESQAKARASQQSIKSLSDKLGELSGDLGTPQAGHDFEEWFYTLMQFSEITARRPYVVDGRQIDGSITIGDTTYLVECKFTAEQSGAPDIDIFRAKVESKADNTMGIFVSISGFSSVAMKAASGKKTPLLLLDHTHIYSVLGGVSSFRDVVERVRRHCSQTGQAYLPASRFDG
jgi:predicted GIY-YIG superfamily endonuclease